MIRPFTYIFYVILFQSQIRMIVAAVNYIIIRVICIFHTIHFFSLKFKNLIFILIDVFEKIKTRKKFVENADSIYIIHTLIHLIHYKL